MLQSYIVSFKEAIKPYLIIIGVIVAGFLVFSGIKQYEKYLINKQTQLEQENAKHKSDIKELTKTYETLKADKAVVEATNSVLEASAAFWKKKAHDTIIIPPTPKPPQDTNVIVTDLKELGVEFKPLTGTLFSTEKDNLPKIWTWGKDSLRIPGLEAKVLNTETALGKSEELVLGLKKDISVSNDMIKTAEQRENIRKLEEANYENQVKTLKREITVGKGKTAIKIGAALVIGYGIGKVIKK